MNAIRLSLLTQAVLLASTTLNAENLRASPSVDGGVPFLEWKRIVPTETLENDRNVDLLQNETGEIWFAFYQRRTATIAIPRVIEAIAGGIFVWTGDDTCGNGGHWIFPGHGPGPAPFHLAIDTRIMHKLDAKQQEALKAYIKGYPATAETALAAITKVLDVLKGAGDILAEGARK